MQLLAVLLLVVRVKLIQKLWSLLHVFVLLSVRFKSDVVIFSVDCILHTFRPRC